MFDDKSGLFWSYACHFLKERKTIFDSWASITSQTLLWIFLFACCYLKELEQFSIVQWHGGAHQYRQLSMDWVVPFTLYESKNKLVPRTAYDCWQQRRYVYRNLYLWMKFELLLHGNDVQHHYSRVSTLIDEFYEFMTIFRSFFFNIHGRTKLIEYAFIPLPTRLQTVSLLNGLKWFLTYVELLLKKFIQ